MGFQLSNLHSVKWQEEVTSMECRSCLLPSCADILTKIVHDLSQALQRKAKSITSLATAASFYILFKSLFTNHPTVSLCVPNVWSY